MLEYEELLAFYEAYKESGSAKAGRAYRTAHSKLIRLFTELRNKENG